MTCETFQCLVSGASASFFLKYGVLDDSRNLCRCSSVGPEVRVMSAVFGMSLVNNDVMCEDHGCNGSVDLE